jgi:hypothetical protein
MMNRTGAKKPIKSNRILDVPVLLGVGAAVLGLSLSLWDRDWLIVAFYGLFALCFVGMWVALRARNPYPPLQIGLAAGALVLVILSAVRLYSTLS